MVTRPAIFVSAVSKELKSARQLVANALHFLGYEPVWEDIFGSGEGDLREVLRKKIDASQGVVHLVGQCYGAEPPAIDAQFGRVSYTQYEAIYARQQGLKVWHLLLDNTFAADPHEAESDELRALQAAYRERIRVGLLLYHPLDNSAALEASVLKLRDELGELRRRGRRWAAVALALLVILVLGILWLQQLQRRTVRVVSDTQESVARTEQETRSVLEHYKQMEQALIKLSDAVTYAKKLDEKLTADQLRERAYAMLEKELGLRSGTLAKELPGFALELYNRGDTTPLMKARAAYALKHFEEAEQLFLDNSSHNAPKLKNVEEVREKLNQDQFESFEGAGQSAMAQFHYARALEHFREAAGYTNKDRDPAKWANVQWNIADALFDKGNYSEAEILFRNILAFAQRIEGPEQRATLKIRTNLADCLVCEGKYAEAEKQYREIISIQQRVFGPTYRDTLQTRSAMTVVLPGEGKYAEAEKEIREVIAIQTRLHGVDDEDTIVSRTNLLYVIHLAGRIGEAEKEARALLAISERVLGPDNPQTLSIRNTLAVTLYDQDKYTEAERENRAALAGRVRVLGSESPDTLASLHNLANSLYSQGNYAAAEQDFQRVAAARERLLGPENPETLMSRMNLANCHNAQGKYAEAEKEHREVLSILERVSGAESGDALICRYSLAQDLEVQGSYSEAEREQRAVLASRERVLPPNHPDIFMSKGCIAWLLVEQGEYPKAEEMIRANLEPMTRVLGSESQIVINLRDCLGEALRGQGRLKESEAEQQAVFALSERALGPENHIFLLICYHLALTLEDEKSYSKALELAQRAETGRLKTSGQESERTKDAIALRQRLEMEIQRQPGAAGDD